MDTIGPLCLPWLTLSVRDIVVGIRLFVAFKFPVMSILMSLILSSLTACMSLLIFLTLVATS
jgi:hypothetical protein